MLDIILILRFSKGWRKCHGGTKLKQWVLHFCFFLSKTIGLEKNDCEEINHGSEREREYKSLFWMVLTFIQALERGQPSLHLHHHLYLLKAPISQLTSAQNVIHYPNNSHIFVATKNVRQSVICINCVRPYPYITRRGETNTWIFLKPIFSPCPVSTVHTLHQYQIESKFNEWPIMLQYLLPLYYYPSWVCMCTMCTQYPEVYAA